jgi:hypothetical protein
LRLKKAWKILRDKKEEKLIKSQNFLSKDEKKVII